MNKVPYGYMKWLQKPLVKIMLSAEFIKAVTFHGFKTLKQIIYFPLRELLKRDWFTDTSLHELSATIDKYWKDLKDKKKASHPKKRVAEI